MAKWTPDKVEEVCGVPEAQVYKVAEMMAKNRPSTIVWCMGQTQHTIGNAIVRASCILQLALGNIGVSGGGANIFRGHDNVQGATDVGPNPDSLPGYYGLATGSWKYWAGVWGVDYEWIKKQYADGMMEKPGMTVSRWIDGVMYPNDTIDQGPNLRAMVYWGHAPNSQTRGKDMVEAMKKLDLMVVIDPYPSATAAMCAMVRKDGVYLLPAATQFETSGSVHGVEPLAAVAREGHRAAVRVASPTTRSWSRSPTKFGFKKELVKNYEMMKDKDGWDEPTPESILQGDQPRHVDDRLHRAVAGAAEAAHEEHVDVRREDAARARRPVRRRLLRPAVAVLRHAGAEASGLAQPVRHVART